MLLANGSALSEVGGAVNVGDPLYLDIYLAGSFDGSTYKRSTMYTHLISSCELNEIGIYSDLILFFPVEMIYKGHYYICKQ